MTFPPRAPASRPPSPRAPAVQRHRADSDPLFVGNSGTTVRFLAALAALVPCPVTLEGDEHMAKRPIADLVDGLRQVGVRVDCDTGCPPQVPLR